MYPDPAEKARGKDMPVPMGLRRYARTAIATTTLHAPKTTPIAKNPKTVVETQENSKVNQKRRYHKQLTISTKRFYSG